MAIASPVMNFSPIRDTIITQMVVRDEVGRRLQMTQGQEQAYYEAHKQEFTQPEQIKLSEILIPTPADANDAAVAELDDGIEGIVFGRHAFENGSDLERSGLQLHLAGFDLREIENAVDQC